MLVHGFISRNEADEMLSHHLKVYGTFCDRTVVILDRMPQQQAICDQFPNVEVHHYDHGRKGVPDFNDNGIWWDESKLRQMLWNQCAAHEPDWVCLADTDEIVTPDVTEWVKTLDPAVDVFYLPWVNLVHDRNHAIGGDSRWSFQNPLGNKKGVMCRWRPGVEYRYRPEDICHVRMEPNPLNQSRAIIDATHVLVDAPKLIHHKYCDWEKWQANPLSQTNGQYAHLLDGATIVDVPAEWHWQ